jgi:chromosome segregation ATPase
MTNTSRTSSSTPVSLIWSPCTTNQTTTFTKSTTGLTKLSHGPSYELLLQRLAHKNSQIKTQDQQIINLELDKADLLLKNGYLKHQKRNLKYKIRTLDAEVALLNKDVKSIAKQCTKEFTTKNKIHAQLKHAILTLRTLEKSEQKLEDENAELLLINCKIEKHHIDLRKLVGYGSSWRTATQHQLMRATEEKMDLDHRVKSLEYELKHYREREMKVTSPMVALKKMEKKGFGLGLDLKIAVRLRWLWGFSSKG